MHAGPDPLPRGVRSAAAQLLPARPRSERRGGMPSGGQGAGSACAPCPTRPPVFLAAALVPTTMSCASTSRPWLSSCSRRRKRSTSPPAMRSLKQCRQVQRSSLYSVLRAWTVRGQGAG